MPLTFIPNWNLLSPELRDELRAQTLAELLFTPRVAVMNVDRMGILVHFSKLRRIRLIINVFFFFLVSGMPKQNSVMVNFRECH